MMSLHKRIAMKLMDRDEQAVLPTPAHLPPEEDIVRANSSMRQQHARLARNLAVLRPAEAAVQAISCAPHDG